MFRITSIFVGTLAISSAVLFNLSPVAAQSTPAATPIAAVSVSATGDPVPAQYTDLYNTLKGTLDSASTSFEKLPSQHVPITFAADLQVADGNIGEGLLKPQALQSTALYLDRFQALGITGIRISVNYPIVLPSYPNSAGYLAFYTQVAQQVRQHHMKLMIQASPTFANTPFSPLKVDYTGMTFQQYEANTLTMDQIIIDNLQPDYLAVLREPDTDAQLTGFKQLLDPTQAAGLVTYVLASLKKGNTLIAAGTGSWEPITFIEKFAAIPNLDAITTHVYPIGGGELKTAIETAALAHKANKLMLMDEAWLTKATNVTGAGGLSANAVTDKLNNYSFVAPLDQEFFHTMVQMADTSGIAFVSFFWSNHLFAYVPYNPSLESLSYNDLNTQYFYPAMGKNVLAGTFSSTGTYYQQLIAQYSHQ